MPRLSYFELCSICTELPEPGTGSALTSRNASGVALSSSARLSYFELCSICTELPEPGTGSALASRRSLWLRFELQRAPQLLRFLGLSGLHYLTAETAVSAGVEQRLWGCSELNRAVRILPVTALEFHSFRQIHCPPERGARVDNLTQAAHVLTASAPRLPIAFAVAHGSEWTRFASEQQLENMGFALEDLESTALTSLVHDADRLELSRWLDSAPNESFVCRLNVPGSDERWVEMWIEQFPEGTPGDASALLVLIDITATLQLEASNSQLRAELETQLQRVMSVLNAARDGIAMWRVQRTEGGTIETFRLEFINESGAAATMRPAAELEGLDFEGVLGGDTFVELKGLFAKAIDTQQIQTSIVDVVSARGCDGTFENRVVPISHDRVVASFRDISEERREQNRLTWLAEHDHLTGAPNRVALERLLRDTLQGARDRNRAAGFVFIDIDDFKNVNDRFGHEAGDKLLVHFVQRLQNAVGSHGEIARIAGDEFAIVLRNVQSMEQFDEVLRAVFQSMQRPFDYLSSDMFITVSAGGVLTRGHEDAFEVMRIADRVMYRVKHEGKNGFQLVDTAEL